MPHPSLDRDLEPYDRLFCAVIRQAIRDYTAHAEDYDEARAFLLDMGLIDAGGAVCTAAMVWEGKPSVPVSRAV